MPCAPLLPSSFNLPSIPGIPVPQLPSLNISLPPIDLPDLTALFKLLNMKLPFNTLYANINADMMKDVLGVIWKLLDSFTPVLSLYTFFLPILELLLCIIEILCALTNPFALAIAIERLMLICIPDFLKLFPFLALIIMIISLLLLILALIIYLIERVLALIELIIHNIVILIKAASRQDGDSILAITKKLGDLLCFLQNLFVIFALIATIINLIKSIFSLVFKLPPCSPNNGGGSSCCSPDFCPAFISNNQTITSSTGNFLYFNEVGIDSGLVLPFGFPPIVSIIRNESWQFYDPNLVQDQQFINITNAFDLPSGTSKIFFPSGVTYTATTDPSSTPYVISFRLLYDPAAYSSTTTGNPRYIRIQNAIVAVPPTTGTLDYNSAFTDPFDGTLNLIGGSITEDDGKTPVVDSNNNPYTIQSFFHAPINQHPNAPPGPTPLSTDGVLYSNITYTFTINAIVLAGYSIITMGCIPSVAAAKNFINATIGAQFNMAGVQLGELIPLLPDMDAAQQCIADNITTFRSSISPESAVQFQTNIMACLTDIQNSTTTALTAAVTAGVDQYTSTFTIDPNIQFINYPIIITVALHEGNNNLITNNLPPTTATAIASQLSAITTFGITTPFVYDGYQFFTAAINSTMPGNGTIKILFNGNYISTLTIPTDLTQPPSVAITVLDYTFVESSQPIAEPRRDAGDVSREGG